ncbi:MAG: VOC family protein [Sphingomonadales bacterium]
MYHHMTVGSNDLAKARTFYDAALGALGAKRVRDMEDRASVWAGDGGQPFIVLTPSNGNPATVGNGLTIAFAAPTPAAVDAFHGAGLAAGGTDEGAPGPRGFAPNAYAAYLRDPDGNKIAAIAYQSN